MISSHLALGHGPLACDLASSFDWRRAALVKGSAGKANVGKINWKQIGCTGFDSEKPAGWQTSQRPAALLLPRRVAS